MKKILVLFFITFTSLSLSSAEYDYIYKGARPMGMGGAFTAVSDDFNALFYNPAGLARVEKGEIEYFNPMFVVNSTAVDILGDISNFADNKKILETTLPYLGKRITMSANISMPFWYKKNFAIALMLPTIRNTTFIRRTVLVEANAELIADAGLLAGYSHTFLDDKLSVGINAKLLVRGAGSIKVGVEDLYKKIAPSFSDIAGYGMGFDFDLGALYTFDYLIFGIVTPTVGISFNNILATGYGISLGGNYKVPDQYGQSRYVNIGSKFDIETGWRVLPKVLFAFDINNIFMGGTLFKKVHMGVETVLFNFWSIRGGINQGYFTFGTGLDAKFAKIEFFTYAEELGESAGAYGDRRYGLQVILGL